MHGPFGFTSEHIDRQIAKKYAGNYALGYTVRRQTFETKVGLTGHLIFRTQVLANNFPHPEKPLHGMSHPT
jgi:hypothetical protein